MCAVSALNVCGHNMISVSTALTGWEGGEGIQKTVPPVLSLFNRHSINNCLALYQKDNVDLIMPLGLFSLVISQSVRHTAAFFLSTWRHQLLQPHLSLSI